ncbi:MAG: hypothetical protein ABI824_10340 [Acidobacteriota bacterium]
MNLVEIIAELRRERAAIEEALSYLEPLVAGGSKSKGRSSSRFGLERLGQANASNGVAPARKRRPFSPATRAKMAASQKARWAAARDGTGSAS